ncbi:Zn-dependent exopeptidase [Mucor ambiguus]|uniref:Peptide hydrolase n=1 Tax=Mucor ambiguus TaxID=91626 RepID=A0A0C9N161_9FUNG|nr:Zn-dependent exopeptidase [Mucor ambiguus]
MSADSDERTPLVPQNHRQDPSTAKSSKRSFHVYGMALGFLVFFAAFIHSFRTKLPTPLSDTQANELDDFSGIHAYNEYLSHFTAPHSGNTRENGVMRDWLASVSQDLQKEATARGLQMDVIANDTSEAVIPQSWFNENEHWFIHSRNVIVRLNGTSGRDEALLVNAHYDSVPTSNGVTDNGMGVATALEMMRYFIEHPPRNTIIFLFNNLEEGGLLGSKTFIHHPWYATVKLFINLEGAGAGGRAMMFRTSNFNAVKKLARSDAKLLHSSPLGNDMFKAQIIKSDTDYSVFLRDGVPGMDIAFYAPRSHYHTPRDNLAYTTPNALQYMGQMALAATKAIANSDDMVDTNKGEELFIYFDILGRWMFVYSFTTYQIINTIALLAVPCVGLFLGLKNKSAQQAASSLIKQKLCLTAQGVIAVFSALIFAALFVGVAVVAMCKINPSMTYGDIYGAGLYTFAAAFLGIQFSQLVLPSKLKQTLATTDAAWYGLLSFWSLFLVLAMYAGSKSIASLYFAVYLLAFNALAALFQAVIPATQKFRSPLIFFTQTIMPFIFLLEITFLSMDALRHATADGTPEIAVYIFIALPLVLIALHYVPWVHVAGNYRKATIAAAVVFVFLFTICSALQPFNGSWSPNKLIFNQEYNAGDALATVIVTSATGVQATIKSSVPAHEYKTIECSPFKKYLTRCTYQTDLLPKYGGNDTLSDFVMSEVEKTCSETTCISSATYASKNSLMCRVLFDPAQNEYEAIQHVWVNGKEHRASNISSIITYINDYEQPVNVKIEYPKERSPKAVFSCFYDEWTKLEIPALNAFRDNLPESATVLIRGQGIALVNYKNTTL